MVVFENILSDNVIKGKYHKYNLFTIFCNIIAGTRLTYKMGGNRKWIILKKADCLRQQA